MWVVDFDIVKDVFVFWFGIVKTMWSLLPNHQHEGLGGVGLLLILHPLDRHVSDDRRVIALDDFALLSVEIEFSVKILSLTLVRDESD